ncbi:flagellar biosynthesis anti-sigma factor FlgM [Oscillospiraceae bacterium 42-9]
MITSPYSINPVSGAVRGVSQIRTHGTPASVQPSGAGEKFDKVTLSAREGEDPYKLELQSKLSQEVRTATTTGTLTALREQVQKGEYRINAESIAKKLLLLGEV